MPIVSLEVLTLKDARLGADNGDQTAIVCVRDENGVAGFGEANAHPGAVKAFLEGDWGAGGWDTNVKNLVLGSSARDPGSLHERCRRGSLWNGRSGIGHVALAALEVATYDLAGKLEGLPVWSLLGRAVQAPRAYVTLYHGTSGFADTVAATVDAAQQAVDLGYTAVKAEALLGGTDGGEQIVKLAQATRAIVGADIDVLLDLGYRWSSISQASPWLTALTELDLRLLEAPFPVDQRRDYQELIRAYPAPVGAGDMLTAAVDFDPLFEAGVTVVQAGAARTGLSDMTRLASAASERGMELISWGWSATTLGLAANVHHAVVTANTPLVEYAPPQMYPNCHIRAELIGPEPEVTRGHFVLPDQPGLGLQLDEDALERFRA